MSNFSENKGKSDRKSGSKPNPPKKENSVSDYIFFTYRSKKERAQERKEYKKGYYGK